GKLRIVHDLQVLNKVTIKDSGIPPSPEEFVESFSGRACYGSGNIMGGYDERELAEISRPLTTFETPLGRLQVTRLPQGATNSVAVYQAQMMWILQDELPQNVGIFIDDGGIKGPTSNYNNEVLAENNGIRRFIWEYAVTLERILFRIEEAGLTVSGKKFAVCVPALEIVGHIVSKKGRTVSQKKKNKIQSWPTPTNKTEVLSFLGTCIYVRMFIPNFGHLASPLRRLTRLKVEWEWTQDCEDSFNTFKQIIGEDIVLAALDYSENAHTIILAVDSSYIAAGGVSMQGDDEGIIRPVFYESEVFSEVESRYSQPKLELCGVAKMMKKFKTKLWGQHFELQVDAKALIQMINTPSLPNAAMTRWVAYIQLFSFDLVHKHGKGFGMPDGLSRRPLGSESDSAESFDEEKKEIKIYENFVLEDMELQAEEEEEVVEEGTMWDQEGLWCNLHEYLLTLKKPIDCEESEYQRIKSKAPLLYVERDRLKKRGIPQGRLVISKLEGQNFILKKLHEELGHRGIEETYKRCLIRFWWPEMKESVRRWVNTCEICQKKSIRKQKEVGRATGENTIFGRVSLDAVHIKAGSYDYAIIARDDLSGWVEAAPLKKLTAAAVAKFIVKEWLMRYGSVKCFTVDGGSEFKGIFREACIMAGAKVVEATAYWPQAEGMVERGHKDIKGALVKLSDETGTSWEAFLPQALFADRISTKRTTGLSPYEMLFSQLAILPVDLEAGTFLGIDWEDVCTGEELIKARMEQLLCRDEVIEKAYKKMMKARIEGVVYWDKRNAHRIRKPLKEGELVLTYNKSLEFQWGKLFKNRWNGPFRIVKQHVGGSYILQELNGVELSRRYAAEHIKRFYPRGITATAEEEEVVSDEEMAQEV
ncbi:MAG: hypothetical protein EOP45_08815, partial [Sphingobacteriaceae bacterium]